MKLPYKNLFFDLDGTLLETGPAIFATVNDVLRGIGREPLSDEELRPFVGPPIRDGMREIAKIPEDQIEEQLRLYREVYFCRHEELIRPYEGISELLKRCKEKGIGLFVATSKEITMAKRHLGNTGLLPLFDEVYAPCAVRHTEKSELIQNGIRDFSLEKSRTAMVGDRKFDLLAAEAAGVPAIGVLYGYGTEAELSGYHAVRLVKTPKELSRFVLGE